MRLFQRSMTFDGEYGEKVKYGDIPAEMMNQANQKRQELVETLADIDDNIGELFLAEEQPSAEQLDDAIRKATIARSFVPVFMGSAFKNKGVQPLLDGVAAYLPAPSDMKYTALDLKRNEQEFFVSCSPNAPLIALAFKLEESRFGQLTYIRIYQGSLKKGQYIFNMSNRKKVKVPRIVRMHSDEMEEIEEAGAGDVVAIFGVECASMDSFTDGTVDAALTSMFVPQPVMSIAVHPKDQAMADKFAKALSKFSREDPTLRISVDTKTKDTILSGMGELHLEIYVERLKREYNVECILGNPSVNYKETVTRKAEFNYLHKKQSGGSGQFARVIGYVEPIPEERVKTGAVFEFANYVIGTNIPPEFIPSCEKGAKEASEKGPLTGNSLHGVRVVLTDGQAHAVDSNDISFRLATINGVRQGMQAAQAVILEPIMSLVVTTPQEFQGSIIAGLNKRMGLIQGSDTSDDGSVCVIKADVPLAQMFGYSTDLRSSTQGKAEFTMEYKEHLPSTREEQQRLIKAYKDALAAEHT
jgi:elongation factor G